MQTISHMTFYYKYAKKVEGKQLKAKEKRSIIDTEKCNVENVMYPHSRFFVCPSCGVCGEDICVIGYNESTVMHKKKKCI